MLFIGSSLSSLLLATLFLFIIETTTLREKAQEKFFFIANLIANRSTAALLFKDQRMAKENLVSLNEFPTIISACLYTADGKLFSSLDKSIQYSCPLFVPNIKNNFHQMKLFIYADVVEDTEKIGIVYLYISLIKNFQEKIKTIAITFIIIFTASIITFLLTLPFLRRISRPLTQLVNTTHKIIDEKDYSLRANKLNNDEVGTLVEAFNEMIAMIEQQNQALTLAKNRYLALYDNNPTMVFELKLNGTIISVNQFGAKQLYSTTTELQGHSIFNFIHPDDKKIAQRFFQQCLTYPLQVHKQEIRKVCHDHIIWVKETARLVIHEKQIKNILLVGENVTETHLLTEKIAYQASHDSLTGLLNRSEFDLCLQQAVQTSHQQIIDHALCYVDLDQFKVVNDTYGHLIGDALLQQLGHLLQEKIYKNDVLARLGGDEFGILMHYCTVNQAFHACETLRNAIKTFNFSWKDKSFTMGVSIGIAAINHYSGDAVDVLKKADAACYAAKEKGRNRVHIFSPDDEELASRQGEMLWVEKIQQGIEQDKFCLYGQLIVPIANKIEGLHFETLIRYKDEQGKLIPPGAFLSAAERYNIACELDRWVINHLFTWINQHPVFLEQLSLCSVNLSGLSLSDETMQNFIVKMFEKYNLPFNKICFEITETAAIANLTNATRFIAYFKDKGCLFSLDDFGSGLSSFAYLKNLPVDFLKIDGLFVKDILEDKIDLAMVRSINEIGHVMNKKTIAEFVENDEIFKLLKTLGVDYAQGYGIRKPVPLDDLIT